MNEINSFPLSLILQFRNAREKRMESATLDSPARAELPKNTRAENRHVLQRGKVFGNTHPSKLINLIQEIFSFLC